MRRAASILALALVLASSAAAADRLSVSLLSSRSTAVDSQWTATISVRRGGKALRNARVSLVARRGRETVAGRARALRGGRYSTRLRFGSAGRWLLTARIGRATQKLGAVTVEQGPLRVRQPFGIVVEPDGRLLVADGAAQRVLRVDPARGRIDAVTDTSLGRPLELARGADGTIFAIAGGRLHRIDAASGRSTVVTGALDGPTSVAVGPSGELYVAEYASRIRRVDPATGVVTTVVASGLDRPHGVEVDPDGRIYVGDTYSGSVKRIEPDGSLTTVASGLAGPTGLALTADGAVLVAEHESGAVTRIDVAGARRITTALSGPSGVAVGPDGTIYVADLEGGLTIGRLDPRSGRVTAVTR
jgi:DNA-binding beta-propeller fold protein YncE